MHARAARACLVRLEFLPPAPQAPPRGHRRREPPVTRPLANRLLALGLLAYVLARAAMDFREDAFGAGLFHWAYTDGLIDYSGGFVRRGLSGEVLGLLAPLASPRLIVALVAWASTLAVAAGLARLALKSAGRLHPVWTAALLLAPAGILFPLHDNGAFARKELLGALVLLADVALLAAAPRRALAGFAALSVFVMPALVLVHEAIAPLYLPLQSLLVALGLRQARHAPTRAALGAAALALPSVLAFAACATVGRGDLAGAVIVAARWEATGDLDAGATLVLPGAIGTLAWAPTQALWRPGSLPPAEISAWLLALGANAALALWAGAGATRALAPGGRPRRVAALAFAAPLVLALPLWAIGCDFGRWFAATTLGFTIVALSPDAQRLLSGAPEEAPADAPPPGPARPVAAWVAVVLAVLALRVPHMAAGFHNTLSAPAQELLAWLAGLAG